MKAYIKKITSVVLSLAIVMSATSFTKFGNTNAKETEATPQEPTALSAENANLEINNLTDLQTFRDNVNSGTTYENETVTLKADIDMSSIDNWDAIGTSSKTFKGTFEGGDHKISNLKIDKGSEDNQGLFGRIASTATIQNLGVENVNVTGRNYVGGLVGYNDGTIETSYAAVKVTGINDVGGLVGYNVGTIENSYATGTTTGENALGGLVGQNNGAITNSYAAVKVTGKESDVGGLVGLNASGTVTNSYYDKDTTGQSDTGKGTPLETAKMTGNAATTNMTGFDSLMFGE